MALFNAPPRMLVAPSAAPLTKDRRFILVFMVLPRLLTCQPRTILHLHGRARRAKKRARDWGLGIGDLRFGSSVAVRSDGEMAVRSRIWKKGRVGFVTGVNQTSRWCRAAPMYHPPRGRMLQTHRTSVQMNESGMLTLVEGDHHG
jgi:hypothetical protein